MGGAVALRDREEVGQLLGEAFATAQAADEALEAFVFRAGPEQDAALIGLFHRRTMRALQMLRGYPGPIVERGPSPVDRAAFSLPGSDSAPRREAATQASKDRGMEQEQAFRGEALYSGALAGALVAKAYSIRVDNIRWLRPGEATILSDQFFLEWLMYREADVECAGPGRRFVASHAVILVPPGPAV